MQDIVQLINQYRDLHLEEVLDFEKFNHYTITHHSTRIEGSTLTEAETRLLLDEELTPGGKPLIHSLMVRDHYHALLFTLQQAAQHSTLSPTLVQEINSRVLLNTGAIYRTLFGDIDSSKGQFRKSNVSAGNRLFVHFEKVEHMVETLCEKLTGRMKQAVTPEDQITLSFDAHFELVTIHPFYDGNGRTARLLMNYIQAFFDLPLAIVFQEDKAAYFEALEDTRKKEDLSCFRTFMQGQYEKFLLQQIRHYLAIQ